MLLFNNKEIPGYARFRIPGVVICADGTVLAYCEARREDGDWAEIDVLLRRSLDGGRTFTAPVVLASGAKNRQTVNNPVMIAGRDGTAHFLYCVEYGLPEEGGGVYYRRSRDGGATWSAPEDITTMTMPDARNVFATGPGHGIELADGTLFVPCWTVLKAHGRELRSHHPGTVCCLTSRDGGDAWGISSFVPPGHLKDPNETAAAQLPDGTVILSVRDGDTHCRCVSVGYSDGRDICNADARESCKADVPEACEADAQETCEADVPESCDTDARHATPRRREGPPSSPHSALRTPLSFTPMEPLTDLPDPVCCAGLTAAPEGLYLTHCHHPRERKNLTLLKSRDGFTWELVRTVIPGPAGYSDLAFCGEALLILYEKEAAIAAAVFPMEGLW